MSTQTNMLHREIILKRNRSKACVFKDKGFGDDLVIWDKFSKVMV